MAKRFEVAIEIIDPKYMDQLIVALVRQGYDVYFNDDDGKNGTVYFTATEEELNEVKYERV